LNDLPYVRRVRQADLVDGIGEMVDCGVSCSDDKREVMFYEEEKYIY
jgi:hypothetical protein